MSVRTKVGRYELGRTLGEGSFAKVKFARNTETEETVAIKVIDKRKVLQHKLVEQITREIATMKLIKHPHVVQLFEVMASKTKIYIVLEFVTGGELFDKIVHQGKLKEDEARKYFQQLINAVDYCHSRGVYHRDLKPENLLLDAQGNLKISDFGLSALSQQVREDGLLHTACGTPNYVAPEVINDKGYNGAAADLWSCGVILYVLMAGYLPFDEESTMTLYKKVVGSVAHLAHPQRIHFRQEDMHPWAHWSHSGHCGVAAHKDFSSQSGRGGNSGGLGSGHPNHSAILMLVLWVGCVIWQPWGLYLLFVAMGLMYLLVH